MGQNQSWLSEQLDGFESELNKMNVFVNKTNSEFDLLQHEESKKVSYINDYYDYQVKDMIKKLSHH